jgi:hypothetical protein
MTRRRTAVSAFVLYVLAGLLAGLAVFAAFGPLVGGLVAVAAAVWVAAVLVETAAADRPTYPRPTHEPTGRPAVSPHSARTYRHRSRLWLARKERR